MKVHALKCWPESFQAIDEGRKRCEVRVNDRGFEVDDILHLLEFIPQNETYTGQDLLVGVTHIFGPEDKPEGLLQGDTILMSIQILVTSERQRTDA